MLKKIGIENIIKSKIATGVEIVILADGALKINILTLKRNKSLISTQKQFQDLSDIVSLADSIDKKTPIILVINGKGIIHRKVSVSENDTTITLLNKVLPNANVNEFYIQKELINSSQAFISVARANVIDDILFELKKNQLTNIVDCLLGPFAVNSILPLIDTQIIDKEQLSFSNYQLLIRDDSISEITVLESDLNADLIVVGDEKVLPQLLIPFAAALSYFINISHGIINSERIDEIKEEYKQKRKFEFFGWTLLLSAFIILMINYFVFDHYWKKSNDMNSELAVNQSSLKKYESLKKEYAQKKDFLEQNGLLENSQTSFYADRLALSLPASIQWTDVNIHPLKKKETNDLSDALSFENKIIKISGKCDRNTELNDWMKNLKKMTWIADVTLVDYKQDNAVDDGLFLIEIKLK